MIVYPAIDIRRGAAVQLVGGRIEEQRVTLPDPLGVARSWISAGFRALHVVDLDAALGTGQNRALIGELIAAAEVPVQVGGGVRDDETAAALFAMGADRLIVGTRALQDPAWLRTLAEQYPRRIVVAADIRDGMVLTHGWTRATPVRAAEFVQGLAEVPLAAVLVTDVSREGRLNGVDAGLFRGLARHTRHALVAAGGIGCMDDLRLLHDVGAAGAVLGMSLYTGAIRAPDAAQEFLT